jgi:hypothetical protein
MAAVVGQGDPTADDSPMMDNTFNFELFGGPGGTRQDELEGCEKMNALPVALIDVQDVSNMVRFLATDDSATSWALRTRSTPGRITASVILVEATQKVIGGLAIAAGGNPAARCRPRRAAPLRKG